MKKDKFEIIKEMYAVNDSNSAFLGTSSYRNMLDNIHKGCYVEAESTNQGGTVVSIIKSKDRIPVCVKVSYKEENGKRLLFVNGVVWFTNISNEKRNKPIDLHKKYSEDEYIKYDNYDAIECGKVANIPMDYDGVIGVPITFLHKYCPEQFEIVGWSRHNDLNMDGGYWKGGKNDATINDKKKYPRILIRAKN